MSSKVCITCKQKLPLDLFSKGRQNKDGLQSKCKPCDRAKNAARRANPELHAHDKIKMRVRQYIRKYNLTKEEALSLVENRNGECQICFQIKPLVIDHCHKSGKVRGKLCSECNTAIGLLKENINYMHSAILYIKENQN